MQVPVKKINLIAASGAIAVLAVFSAYSQSTAFGDHAPPGDAASAAPAPAAATSSSDSKSSSDTASSLDYLYNHKPQDGSVAKKAADDNSRVESKAIAADAVGTPSEDPQFKADFDRYLGTPEVSAADLASYQAEVKKVTDLLDANQTVAAWKELDVLAQYESIDAGISKALANRIEAVWMTGKASTKIDKSIDNLKKDINSASWNADLISVDVRRRDADYADATKGHPPTSAPAPVPQAPAPGGAPGAPPAAGTAQQAVQQSAVEAVAPPDTTGIQGKLQLTQEYLETLEAKAKIKMNEMKQEKLSIEAEKDFSDYITTLSKSGRLTHVILAADFYRKVFDEGEYPVDMANQVNEALETARSVDSSVDVFHYKIDRKELSGATATLADAFGKSPLNPSILGLQRDLKEKIATYRQKLDRLQNLIETRDFTSVDGLLSDIKGSATDFDDSKAKAIVNGVKLDSQLRLGQAKLAAQQGDQKAAMDDFQAAAEAWPGNPDLQDKAALFFNTQDVKTQSTDEFDRLVQEQNYREIFDKQLAFAPAIHGDAKREGQLKDALLKVQNAEIAIQKANTLLLNGDSSGAWETIELAANDLPDDKKLNKMLADLSSRSAEFVSSISKAREAERKNEVGYSLTWYVNAQQQYPASQIANEGIDRLSKKLLQTKS